MPSFRFRPIVSRFKVSSDAASQLESAQSEPAQPKNKEANSGIPAPIPVPIGSAWQIFLIWLLIGFQSFGGGATTFLLIRREILNKRGWFNDQEYTEMWTLCNLAPGINLLAFSIIIGKRLAGLPGSFACLLGLALPSAIVTTLLTAGFTSIQNWSPFQAIMHGVLPAVIGISFVFVVQFALPILKQSWYEGKSSFVINFGWAAACAILLGFFKLSAVLVFVLSALAGALILPRVLPGFTQTAPPPVNTPVSEAKN